DAAARPRAGRVGAVEALEEMLEVLLVEPRPRVGGRGLGATVPACDRDGSGRARWRVGADVREEVVDDLAQPNTVAEHGRGLGVELDRAIGVDGLRRLDRLAHHLVQL